MIVWSAPVDDLGNWRYFYYDGDCRTENCIRLQKSFPNFLHSSHALWCVAAYFLRKEQMQMKLVLAEKLSVAQSIAKGKK